MNSLNTLYQILQGQGDDKVGKLIGTATAGGFAGVTTDPIDWYLYTGQSLINVILAATIGYTISFFLGKLYKYLWHKYINPKYLNK